MQNDKKKKYFFSFFQLQNKDRLSFQQIKLKFYLQVENQLNASVIFQQMFLFKDFVIFYFKIEMFVDTTFLNTLDRLSVQSTLTGKTGTLCGVIGTLGLICAIVLMYLWPVVNYFQGDYIQGTYLTQKHEDLSLSTGENLKLSISFVEKSTGKVIDHLSLRQYIKTNIYYLSAADTAYYSNVVECYDNYFSQMDTKPENTNYKDCYISPNGLIFKSETQNHYLSVFGFKMDPICRDPLACTFNSSVNAAANSYRLQFFSNHYYVVRFTSSYLDDYGNLKKKFYQTYSSEWQARESIIPIMYTLFQTAKVYMDDSIMPWINNQTIIFPQWMGLTAGLTTTSSSVQNSGFGTYFTIEDNQRVYTREYKKLDWLLGIIGGGMVFLYIIFYVPFNFMATLKQKYQTCISTILVRHDKQNFYSVDNAFRPTFNNPIWWITRLIQLDLKMFKQQNRSLECSEKLLDISELVKKMKIAKKNLSRSNQLQFQPLTPEFLDQKNRQFSEEQKRLEIRQDVINQIVNRPEIGDTLNNHLPLLALLNKYNQQNSSKLKLRMNAIMSNQSYSKYKVPDLANEKKHCCVRVFQCLLKYFSKVISFFDVFGAKPNFSATPQNYTVFGCIITLIIIVLSILTFALTIRNMNVQRTYWDNIYENPQNKNVDLTTGKNFKMALCFPSVAIDNYLITTMSRKVNVQFYQYTREKMVQSFQYYHTNIVTSDSDDFFDMTSESYNIYDFSNCLKPDNNIDIKIYGDSHSQNQAYVGFRITPFCPGAPSSCNTTIINNDFFNILNKYKINILTSQSKYYPDLGKVQQNPVPQDVITSMQSNTLHLNKSVYQELSLQTLQIIDHYGNWFMSSGYPPPKEKYLNLDFQSYQSRIVSADTPDPQYKLKVVLSGKVSRVIFSSYKLDFLLAMIGGCFAFYYIIFSCIGRAYNRYNIKRKLAQTLYDEQYVDITVFKAFCQSLGLPFCGAPLLPKIQKSIDCVELAKNVDNVYRLSVATYNNALEKDLALIYLKERIKEDQQIEIKKQSGHEANKADEFIDREFVIQKNQQIFTDNQLNNSQHTILNSQKQVQAQYFNQESAFPSAPTVRELQKCSKLVNNFDIFANDSQLTLDGKRSVKSVCGGFCFIILTIFICILTYHFLTIYISQIPRVSINKIVEQNSENLKMNFKVGQNMKLALSFYKADDFSYFNVFNITTDVGLAVMKYRVQRLNASFQTTVQTVPLEPCSNTYLNNFNTSHDSIDLLNNLDKAFCVPDGTQLSIYGSPQDKIREYFSLKIYNKQSINSTSSNQTIQLLKNYLVRYHISSPIVDFSPGGGQYFSMTDIAKTDSYQVSTSKSFNITLTKNQITYDTAMYAKNQRPSFNSYGLHTFKLDQFSSSYSDSTDRLRELNFVGQNLYNIYTVKTIKVYQVFGIIGGCIAFLFFGFGCFPRSFNQYKMKYLIGSKLYTILGKKKKKESKNVRGKKQKTSKYRSQLDLTQFSDWRVLLAWFLSHISFFTRNFNLNQSLRHVTLLESRVSRDINIFQFLKDLYACESAIRGLNLSTVNLSRVNLKQIISLEDQDQNKQQQLIDQIRNYNTQLEDAAKVNKFTFWELKIILTGKEKGIDFSSIFKQKWLDRFVGIDRSTVGTRTQISSSLSSYNQDGSVTSQNHTQSQRPTTEDNQSIDDKEVKKLKKPNLKEIQQGQDEEQSQNEFEVKQIQKGNLKINEKQQEKEQSNKLQSQEKTEKKENTNARLQIIQRDNHVQFEDQVDLERKTQVNT